MARGVSGIMGDGVVVLSGSGTGAGAGMGSGNGAGVTVLVFLPFGLDLGLLLVFDLLGTMTTCPVEDFIRRNRLVTHTATTAAAFDIRLSFSDLRIILTAPA